MSISDQKKTLEAGFLAVAQNNVKVVHVTDSDCFDPDTAYIPFASIEEGISHGNVACSKCHIRNVVNQIDADTREGDSD